MGIKWSNVVAFGLAIFGVVLAVRHRRDVGAILASIGQLGPAYTPEERIAGFCVLGVLSVAGVAIVRLLLSSDGKKNR